MCLVDNSDYYSGITAALAKAYFSQDINRIKAVMDEKQNTACDSTPEEDAALIYTRNADWLTKMPAVCRGSRPSARQQRTAQSAARCRIHGRSRQINIHDFAIIAVYGRFLYKDFCRTPQLFIYKNHTI